MASKLTVYVVIQSVLDAPIRAIFATRDKAERFAFAERRLYDIGLVIEAWQVDAAVVPGEGQR